MQNLHVYHRPRSECAYATAQGSLHVRVQAGRGQFVRCRVVYGDPFRWTELFEQVMESVLSSARYDYFEVDIHLPLGRFAYYFILHTADGSELRFNELGLSSELGSGEHAEGAFHFQYTSESTIFEPPPWVQDSIFYLIFPDRFRTNMAYTGGQDTEMEREIARYDAKHKGGNLDGVRRSLDYLQELGVSVLYFTPIFTAQSYHRYDTINYYEIDPLLGTKEEFRTLVQEAHGRGMRVILDAVFNHCGSEFPQFLDVVLKGSESEFVDWFYIRHFPVDVSTHTRRIEAEGWAAWHADPQGATALEYETFGHTPYMPRLRTSNAAVQNYCIDVALYWIREFDIDGWRLDVADEVDPEFWRAFRRAVKACKPSAYILGEVWYDARFWLDGTQFDAVMNYSVYTSCIDFFARGSIGAAELESRINDSLMRYSWQVNLSMLNLFESHDTDRFLTAAGGNARRLILAYCFILSLPGAPLFYYGSELGMQGSMPHGNREVMNWNEDSWNAEILREVRQLSRLRRENKALSRGKLGWLRIHQLKKTAENTEEAAEKVLAYSRSSHTSRIEVYINCSETSLSLNTGAAYDLVKQKNIQTETIIPAYSFLILEKFLK